MEVTTYCVVMFRVKNNSANNPAILFYVDSKFTGITEGACVVGGVGLGVVVCGHPLSIEFVWNLDVIWFSLMSLKTNFTPINHAYSFLLLLFLIKKILLKILCGRHCICAWLHLTIDYHTFFFSKKSRAVDILLRWCGLWSLGPLSIGWK